MQRFKRFERPDQFELYVADRSSGSRSSSGGTNMLRPVGDEDGFITY
jgi:hypothetical protein